MKAPIIKIISGLGLLLLSLWVGAYFIDKLSGTWAGFPAFATAGIIGAGGYIIMFWGIASFFEGHKPSTHKPNE